jgi:DNA-binding transcriptional LysR family regulator
MEPKMEPSGDMGAFVRVVERRSFSAAAQDLGLSPSAVSKLITRLEDRLGSRLLHRTTRRLSLTSEGEHYFIRARKILVDIAEAEAEVARSQAEPNGRLRINTSIAFATYQLAPSLPEFIARYPNIAVELFVTDRIVDLVEDHADVTIRAGRIPETTLSARRIADFRRVICASPEYLEKHGTPHVPPDLASHACISLVAADTISWPFRTSKGIEQVQIIPRLTSDNGDVALRLALSGTGIVRLAELLVGEPIRRGALVPILTDFHHAEPIALTAIYLAGKHRLPKVRVFLDFLVEKFSRAPWRIEEAAGQNASGY